MIFPGMRNFMRLSPRCLQQTYMHCRTVATKGGKYSVTFFHNPDNEKSKNLLRLYEGYRTNPYPRPTNNKPDVHPPLDFDLNVIERVPTVEEFSDMLLMIRKDYAHPTAFLRVANNAVDHPTNAKQLHKLVTQDPSLMIWPLAVIWDEYHLALDKPSFMKLVRKIVERRDGITKDPTPPPPRRPIQRVDEWIDYD